MSDSRLLLALGAACAVAAAEPLHAGRRDFDFLLGKWKVHNRRLLKPLSGENQWIEFEGTSHATPILGGMGNTEDWRADPPSGAIRALSIHLYNPSSRQWSLYWATDRTGSFDRPLIGEFHGNGGEFYDRDLFEGRAVWMRFIWTNVGPAQARWEQAMSTDGGKSWETYWVMEFSRVAEAG